MQNLNGEVIGSARLVREEERTSSLTMAEEEEVEKYKRLYEEQKQKVKELERQNSQLKVSPSAISVCGGVAQNPTCCSREIARQRALMAMALSAATVRRDLPDVKMRRVGFVLY